MNMLSIRVKGALDLARMYVLSALRNGRYRKDFRHVETFCIFIGYPRSGHTLIGSLLDAHRNMVIALELDALRLARRGFSRNQLYYLLLENSRAAASAGRTWTGYSYQVPGQWQGRYETLKVIGDKKGGESSKHLRSNMDLIGKLRSTVGVNIKAIHVVRNPFDNISTMLLRGHASTLDESITEYFKMAQVVAGVQKTQAALDVLTVRHETFIDNPKPELVRACSFLGVDAPDNYVESCASIVFENPHKTRHDVQWDAASVARVNRSMQEYEFLADYAF